MYSRRETRGNTGTEEDTGEEGKPAEFGLATDRVLTLLICHVARAVRMLGAGLGFPVGGTFGFTPPTSDILNKRIRLTETD